MGFPPVAARQKLSRSPVAALVLPPGKQPLQAAQGPTATCNCCTWGSCIRAGRLSPLCFCHEHAPSHGGVYSLAPMVSHQVQEATGRVHLWARALNFPFHHPAALGAASDEATVLPPASSLTFDHLTCRLATARCFMCPSSAATLPHPFPLLREKLSRLLVATFAIFLFMSHPSAPPAECQLPGWGAQLSRSLDSWTSCARLLKRAMWLGMGDASEVADLLPAVWLLMTEF